MPAPARGRPAAAKAEAEGGAEADGGGARDITPLLSFQPLKKMVHRELCGSDFRSLTGLAQQRPVEANLGRGEGRVNENGNLEREKEEHTQEKSFGVSSSAFRSSTAPWVESMAGRGVFLARFIEHMVGLEQRKEEKALQSSQCKPEWAAYVEVYKQALVFVLAPKPGDKEKDKEPWLQDKDELVERLRKAIKKSFRGKPEFASPPLSTPNSGYPPRSQTSVLLSALTIFRLLARIRMHLRLLASFSFSSDTHIDPLLLLALHFSYSLLKARGS